MNEEDAFGGFMIILATAFVFLFLSEITTPEKPTPKPVENRGGIIIHIPQEVVDAIKDKFIVPAISNNTTKVEN